MEPLGTLVGVVAILAVAFESYRSALLLGGLAFWIITKSL